MSPEQAAAREYIVEACKHLAVGRKATFAQGLVLLAFPVFLGARLPSLPVGQLLDALNRTNSGIYGCYRDPATGNFIVTRLEAAER